MNSTFTDKQSGGPFMNPVVQSFTKTAAVLMLVLSVIGLAIGLIQQMPGSWATVTWIFGIVLALFVFAGIYGLATGKMFSESKSWKSQRAAAIVVIIADALLTITLLITISDPWSATHTFVLFTGLVIIGVYVVQFLLAQRMLRAEAGA
jgi:hypothetical protein